MTFHQGAPVEGRAPCVPSSTRVQCGGCARYRPWLGHESSRKHLVVLDVSILLDAGEVCPLRIPSTPMPRRIWSIKEDARATRLGAFA